MSNTDKLQEIKERWNNATSGPWKWVDNGMCLFPQNGADYGDYIVFIQKSGFSNAHDSEAIANAPTDVAWLISQLEQAQAENDRLKVDKQKLIEVAEYYADKKNHQYSIEYTGDIEEIWEDLEILTNPDSGEFARQVLREVKGNGV